MSGGERENIAKAAKKVASKILPFLGWECVGPVDQNFACTRPIDHTGKDVDKHNHPTDVVFRYFDPYRKKYIYLNTDLKSYGKSSIKPSALRNTLNSMGRSIECARSSQEWKDRYQYDDSNGDIEGLLFVYNHDDEYKNDLLSKISGFESGVSASSGNVRAENLSIAEGMQITVFDPLTVKYILSFINDFRDLMESKSQEFGEDVEISKSHYFCYPDLKMHKSSRFSEHKHCIIENIASPYFIIGYDLSGSKKKRKGVVVYYRDSASCEDEFLYLFDLLSNFQFLKKNICVDIRIFRSNTSNVSPQSYFAKAQDIYIKRWSLMDEDMSSVIKEIQIESITSMAQVFIPEDIGWDED